MKKWLSLNLMIASVLILGACATSNDVVSNRLISKRKYEKGFHINKKSHLKSSNEELANENLTKEKDFEKKERLFASNNEKKTTKTAVKIEELETSVESSEYTSSTINSESTIASVDGPESNSILKSEPSRVQRAIEKENAQKEVVVEQSKGAQPSGTAELVLLIILALFIPPLAIVIYSGATTWFWVDLILFIVAIGGIFSPFRLIGLAGLAAVIIAFLVIFDVI